MRYLAERSLSDDAEPLKEYTIGVDVFGKNEDYDTRLDASVRIQIGRLRQRLTEYYAVEGVNDEVVVSLPKGHFKLSIVFRAPSVAAHRDVPLRAISTDKILVTSDEVRWRRAAYVLAAALVAAIFWGSFEYVAPTKTPGHRSNGLQRWRRSGAHSFIQIALWWSL